MKKETEKSSDVIAGKVHINGKLARILIDPSATFLFLSSTFIMHDKLRIDDLNEPVIRSIPMGTNVVCKKVCRNILVEIDGGKLNDFIPSHLDEFDITQNGWIEPLLSQYKLF